MSPIELLLCLVLVMASGFLSATEVALFSLSRFQLRQIRENFLSSFTKIKKLVSDPGGLLITILVANEVVNISLSTIIADAVAKNWGEQGPWYIRILPESFKSGIPIWGLQTLAGILITTPILLFLCEITPKAIGTRANQIVGPITAGPMEFLYKVFKPVRILIQNFIVFLSYSKRKSKKTKDEDKARLKEEDFMIMVEEGRKEGMIHQTEVEMIQNVFNLDDTKVSKIYTPLSKVYAIPLRTKVNEALKIMQNKRYFRIPVYSGTKKNVVGILYAKDLVIAKLRTERLDDLIEGVMRRPFFVSESMHLNSLFRRLKQSHTHMAIVTNTQKQPIGIVTMSDILEEVFEDLFTEENGEGLS